MKIEDFFDLSETIVKDIFIGVEFLWEVIPKISNFILEIGPCLPKDVYEERGAGIWIAKTAEIESTALINGPLIIGPKAEIRHCAYIRGSAIVGEKAVVGNSSELKNSILFNHAQIPHFNYVGDSILGYRAHMGAGSIASNLKSDKTNVSIKINGTVYKTGLRKLGAILGDCVEIGCGSVLNPGTIIGKNSRVYPLSAVRGYIPENSIYKKQGETVNIILNT
ncbi:MAG: UDP-N-acetylglucosamine pyrophosphorylase [Clostridiales bacterium]|jgi:NDP-sugar pyrophosphorylase family protein|nr:UDP-N-acetylglucosamine pyrophosphorylase [Clostridiales bacterium]